MDYRNICYKKEKKRKEKKRKEKKKSQLTLTILSQPHETIIGFWVFGENLTNETHSVWLSSWMVYLHCPSVFHNLIVLSREPETICRLSAEKATLNTSFV